MPEVRVMREAELMGPAHAARRPNRADDLWVVVNVDGKRRRQKIGRPTERNQARAEEMRADWQAAVDLEVGMPMPVATFRSAANSFLEEGLRARATKTKSGRRYQLQSLVEHFGDTPLAALDLDGWWKAEVEGKRDWRTGTFYLTAISLVFKHAHRQGVEIANPVPAARERLLGDIRNTKEYRRRNQDNLSPLSLEQLRALFAALEQEPDDFLVSVFLLYECGLRFGEMRALTWADVRLGRDADDTTRHLYVQNSETDGVVGATKTGESRKVGLSRRARALLLRWQLQAGRPQLTDRVVASLWGGNFRSRLGRACARARIPTFTPKDFRDTYASQLITHGIVLKWISLQLGHARVATTEKHYAAYLAIDGGYENPWQVPAGHLPTDLFAELDGWHPELRHQNANICQQG